MIVCIVPLMKYNQTQALSRMDRSDLMQLSRILLRADGVAHLTNEVDQAIQPRTATEKAMFDLKTALINSARLQQSVAAALRLQSVGFLPAGQRPKKWEGPTPPELFDLTTSWDRLYPIKWWQFEHLVAETFRRLGFDNVAVVNGDITGDGGVDIHMTHRGALCVVQCKHFAAGEYVPIDKLRAFATVAQYAKATGYFVTSGKVGKTACKEMSQVDPPVFVVDGERLWRWIQSARGANQEEVLYPGRQDDSVATKDAGEPDTSAGTKLQPAAAVKSGCMSVLVIGIALMVVFAALALMIVT